MAASFSVTGTSSRAGYDISDSNHFSPLSEREENPHERIRENFPSPVPFGSSESSPRQMQLRILPQAPRYIDAAMQHLRGVVPSSADREKIAQNHVDQLENAILDRKEKVWAQENSNCTPQIWHDLAPIQRLRLVSLLYQLVLADKELPPFSVLLKNMTIGAKKFYSLLNQGYNALKIIMNTQYPTPDLRLASLAFWVNGKKTCIQNVLPIVEEELLLEMTPYLCYFDLGGVTVDLQKKILEKSVTIHYLHLYHSQIEMLPDNLSACREINCASSCNIQRIPSLPRARTVDFSYCENLRFIPLELPLCERLDYRGCSLIQLTPRLSAEAIVLNDTTDIRDRWKVNKEDITNSPIDMMIELGRILQERGFLPSIDLFENGQRSVVIDAGGPRRQVISDIIANLQLNKEYPQIDLKSGKTEGFYIALGRLLAFCFQKSEFVSGPALLPEIYSWIRMHPTSKANHLPEAWKVGCYFSTICCQSKIDSLVIIDLSNENSSKQIPKLSDEQWGFISYLVDSRGDTKVDDIYFASAENRAALRAKLLKKAESINSILQAVAILAYSIKESLKENEWCQFHLETCEDLINRVEGKLSLDVIKEQLNFSGGAICP